MRRFDLAYQMIEQGREVVFFDKHSMAHLGMRVRQRKSVDTKEDDQPIGSNLSDNASSSSTTNVEELIIEEWQWGGKEDMAPRLESWVQPYTRQKTRQHS